MAESVIAVIAERMIEVILLAFSGLVAVVSSSKLTGPSNTVADAEVLLLIVLMYALVVKAHVYLSSVSSASSIGIFSFVDIGQLLVAELIIDLAGRARSTFAEA